MFYLLLILFGVYLGYFMDELIEEINVKEWRAYRDDPIELYITARAAFKDMVSDIEFLFKYFVERVLRIV